ncbi:(E2-independent) E3 ubiquitin-conjugating enzyme FATS [Pangasianodon hypophthalmus]|uniref:(E2-independent) E3 ubiquitin-conjugating enzyme FATS n=1 Tax=Pangasianodon hypophthalmus TaxID=310915 RepID=UPI002307EFD1|nr:(E2-independent) E3 ubiquitin-conjugating enzyme FATS [Pangasianodon hypophthalmus]
MGLRNWRLTSQSSPDINEAENKESCPLLQTNALTTLRSFRSEKKEREQDIKQWRRTTASLCSATGGNKPQKTESKPISSPDGPSVSWTLIDPQTHCCSPTSGFISITISTRKISSPLKQPGQIPSSSRVSSTVKNDKACSNSPVPFSCKATMVKVTEHRERYEADQKNTYSLSVSKRPTFSSSVHLEILSCQSPSSIFYLYKLLSVPLFGPQDNRPSVHRSALFLSIRKLHLFSSLERPQEATRHLLKPCEQNIIDCNGTVEKTHCFGMAIVKSRTSRGDTSSDTMVQLANLSPLPFKARYHSSSEAVRVNEKANDVSGTVRSNQREYVEGPVTSGVRVRASSLGRIPCSHTEMVPSPQECVVFSHLLNSCSCGSNSTNQLHLLSLKEALQLFRPDFIIRSQRRVHQLEQRARKRRSLQPADSMMLLQATNRRQICTKPHPLSDNLFKPKDRVISGKEMQLRSRRIYNKLPEVTKKKEEERRRLVLQTNRLKAEVFKKKLLDQILQRNGD